MEKLYLRIAGFNILLNFEIDKEFENQERIFIKNVESLFKGFIISKVSKKLDFRIKFTEQTSYKVIINTFKKSKHILFYQEFRSKTFVTFYHISLRQLQILIRDVCQKLLAKNKGLILHGAASIVNNTAYIFFGNSGAGKSTVVNLISGKFTPLADDTLIIKKEGKEFFFYQTPFPEKNINFVKNRFKLNIGKIFFLRKSEFNKAELFLKKEQQTLRLLKQIFSNQEEVLFQTKTVFRFLARFNSFYLLNFSKENKEELMSLIAQL